MTKFLDVGVNLKDMNLRNIVIFHTYQEELIQMLGRKRIQKNEQITVYLKLPTRKKLQRRVSDLNIKFEKLSLLENTHSSSNSLSYNELPPNAFVRKRADKLEMIWNHFSLRINRYHYEQLKRLLQNSVNDYDIREKYIFCVKTWLPGCHCTDTCTSHPSSVTDILEKLLTSRLGITVNKEEYGRLCDQIFEICNVVRRKSQEGNVATNKLKEIFKQHGLLFRFRNLSKDGKTGSWLLERGSWE